MDRPQAGGRRTRERAYVETIIGFDTRLAKALSHPVRAKALGILNLRVASPSDIAAELELPIANVSYHVGTLLRLGAVEEVEARHVRGAIEHLYRAIRRPWATLDDAARLPANMRQQWFEDVAAMAFEDIRWAARSELFGDRPDQHASATRLRLDERGWREVYDVLDRALRRCVEIHEESVGRLEGGAAVAREMPAMLSIFFYDSPPH
jgi:DNA-binding transcriptional ArsR family regulator